MLAAMVTQNSDRRARDLLLVVLAYAVALVVALAVGWALRDRHPILVAAAADLVATLVVFGFSVGYDNSSLYDPYWSVIPLPIAIYFAAAGEPGLGQLLLLALVALWGARLTGNWAARWRGIRDEDFRYQEIRGRTGRFYWPASFVSIHLLPTIWVFLGLLPLYPVLARPSRLTTPAIAALIMTAAAIAIEAIADRQLRAFLRTRRDPEAVLDKGLWAYCRHPNYLGEILFWWGLYLFGLAAEPAWAWSVVGPLSITLLFVFISVPWMDRRLLLRHPAWAQTMRSLPALLPWLRRREPTVGSQRHGR
jgi:steroid 5-alpha reductase family enzyme